MVKHEFIFNPGQWVGEGRITFSASPELVRFYTSWWIEKPDEKGGIRCQQRVEMQGSEETVNNNFFVNDVTPAKFKIELENDLIGKVQGLGVIDAKTIAWEFRGNAGLEGFEVYELQDNGDYMLHAEYSSPDQFRTIIDGRVWKRST